MRQNKLRRVAGVVLPKKSIWGLLSIFDRTSHQRQSVEVTLLYAGGSGAPPPPEVYVTPQRSQGRVAGGNGSKKQEVVETNASKASTCPDRPFVDTTFGGETCPKRAVHKGAHRAVFVQLFTSFQRSPCGTHF